MRNTSFVEFGGLDNLFFRAASSRPVVLGFVALLVSVCYPTGSRKTGQIGLVRPGKHPEAATCCPIVDEQFP